MKLHPRQYEAQIKHPDFNYEKGLETANKLLKEYFKIEKPLDCDAPFTTKAVVKKDERKYTVEILRSGTIHITSWQKDKEHEQDIQALEKILSVALYPEDNTVLLDQFSDDVKKRFEK